MAGILDWLNGAPSQPSGLFGGAVGVAGRPVNRLGVIGATLSDVGANLAGRPSQATALDAITARQQQQALLSGLTSSDPIARQKAYQTAALYGINPKPFEDAQAAAAMPKLLDTMQNGRPMDSAEAAKFQGIPNLPRLPVNGISGALGAVNNPELTAQLAPTIIKARIAAQQNSVQTLTPQELPQYGINPASLAPGTVVQRDANGNLKVVKTGDLMSQGAVNQKMQIREAGSRSGSESGFGPDSLLTVIPSATGNYGITRSGGVIPLTDAAGKPIVRYTADPNNKFSVSAAGSSGSAAGKQSEAWPATQQNYNNIFSTLNQLGAPDVKDQATHALGWQSFLPNIPGVNTHFNALRDQLKGQIFLQAYQSLRGGGQITEAEGEKADASLARLQKAQTPKEFYDALNDFKGIVQRSYGAARQRASRGATVGAMAPGPALPAAQTAPSAGAQETKTLNGVTYHKINGQWMQE